MSELSALNVGQLIHSFVRHLAFQVSPVCNKKLDKINFTFYIDDAYRLNLESLGIGEKSKEIAIRSSLNIADVENVCYFIERQTKFLDKFVYTKSTPLLTCHFDRINKTIVQNRINKTMVQKKVQKKDISEMNQSLAKEFCETKYHENRSPKLEQIVVRRKHKDLSLAQAKDIARAIKCNLTESSAEYARREKELNEKYLQLYINNVEFMKKNVHVTLHIANKTLYDTKYCPDTFLFAHDEKGANYQRTLMLCEHAIRCLIEPSTKVSVCTEDDLSVVIQSYLSRGYEYRFDFASDVRDRYSALLILSEWAKPLVRHPDTAMLRAISAALRCSVCDILILSRRSNDDS